MPDGGGHRVLGRRADTRRHGAAGYDHFEVFIDDASRLAHIVPVTDERPLSVVGALEQALAWFANQGIRVERVLTDNGSPYVSRAYAAAVERHGVRHKRTRPYRPQTNGKAERFIRTMLAEWAYGRRYDSNSERLGPARLAPLLQPWTSTHGAARPDARGECHNVRGNHS